MTKTDVESMSLEALEKLLDFGSNPKICEQPKCYNASARGYRFCLACLHGVAPRADDVLVAAKKRYERLSAKQRREDGGA